VADGFSWPAFFTTLLGAMLGIAAIGAAFSGFIFTAMHKWERWYVGLVGLLFVAPGLTTMAIATAAIAPVLLLQWRRAR